MDIMLELLTNPKLMRKRDGRMQPFQFDKLERSLTSAFRAMGQEDEALVRAIVEEVLQAFGPVYVKETAPETRHLREAIVSVLETRGLSHIKERYARDQKPGAAPQTPAPAPVATQTPTPTPSPMPTPSTPPEAVYIPLTNTASTPVAGDAYAARRRRLNDERKAVTHKFQVGGYEGYLTVGLYDDGTPGEIFLRMNKEGSILSSLMDAFATAISIGLQYGVPLKVLVAKFAGVHFEPNGPTQNPNIPHARSIMDYIFRWLALKFLTPEERQTVLGIHMDEPVIEHVTEVTNVDGARQSRLLDNASV